VHTLFHASRYIHASYDALENACCILHVLHEVSCVTKRKLTMALWCHNEKHGGRRDQTATECAFDVGIIERALALARKQSHARVLLQLVGRFGIRIQAAKQTAFAAGGAAQRQAPAAYLALCVLRLRHGRFGVALGSSFGSRHTGEWKEGRGEK
jgi:plasmid replication initiation protein